MFISFHSITNFFSIPSIVETIETMSDSVQQKALEVFQNGITFDYTNVSYQQLITFGISTSLTCILIKNLFQYVFPGSKKAESVENSEFNEHFIVDPDSARQILRGHRYDKNHKYNRFSSEQKISNRPFDCLTALDSKVLRHFLIYHLNKTFLEKNDVILNKAQEWISKMDGMPSHHCFLRGAHEVKLFVMTVCWQVFVGSKEPRKDFCPECFEGDEGFRLSDLDILRDCALERNIRDEDLILNMINDIIPGCTTFSSLITEILCNLSKNLDLQEALFKEFTETEIAPLEFAITNDLLYKIIAESIRTYPGLQPIKRKNAREEFELENSLSDQKMVVIKKGDNVHIGLKEMKMDPRIVGPNPDIFDLNRKCLDRPNLKDLDWLPFGSGFNICPAAKFVQKFSALIITAIVCKYQFSIGSDNKVKITSR